MMGDPKFVETINSNWSPRLAYGGAGGRAGDNPIIRAIKS